MESELQKKINRGSTDFLLEILDTIMNKDSMGSLFNLFESLKEVIGVNKLGRNLGFDQ